MRVLLGMLQQAGVVLGYMSDIFELLALPSFESLQVRVLLRVAGYAEGSRCRVRVTSQ